MKKEEGRKLRTGEEDKNASRLSITSSSPVQANSRANKMTAKKSRPMRRQVTDG